MLPSFSLENTASIREENSCGANARLTNRSQAGVLKLRDDYYSMEDRRRRGLKR